MMIVLTIVFLGIDIVSKLIVSNLMNIRELTQEEYKLLRGVFGNDN